ncbi:MAG: c-type cytochrome [Chitinophagaceae bacterium]
MNKLLCILLISGLFSCGSGGDSSSGDKKQTDNGLSSNPDYQKGLELIAKSDCLTCHKVDETLTGPKYRDVANKYAGMPDTIIGHLAGKIIQGGTGVWGQVYMTPHPTLSREDAEAMVKYILLLKK